MPQFNVFPEAAEVVESPQGDTLQIEEDQPLNLDDIGHIGDWHTEEDRFGTTGYVQLEVPIIYVDDSGKGVLVPPGAYLHYGTEGFYVWKETFHEEALAEARGAA